MAVVLLARAGILKSYMGGLLSDGVSAIVNSVADVTSKFADISGNSRQPLLPTRPFAFTLLSEPPARKYLLLHACSMLSGLCFASGSHQPRIIVKNFFWACIGLVCLGLRSNLTRDLVCCIDAESLLSNATSVSFPLRRLHLLLSRPVFSLRPS